MPFFVFLDILARDFIKHCTYVQQTEALNHMRICHSQERGVESCPRTLCY